MSNSDFKKCYGKKKREEKCEENKMAHISGMAKWIPFKFEIKNTTLQRKLHK